MNIDMIETSNIVFFSSLMSYFELYSDLDAHITCPEPSNPWVSDNLEFWEQETSM